MIVTLLAFSLYPYLQNEPLSAAKAFSSLALFDILSLPLHLFPLIVNVIINGKVNHQITLYLYSSLNTINIYFFNLCPMKSRKVINHRKVKIRMRIVSFFDAICFWAKMSEEMRNLD